MSPSFEEVRLSLPHIELAAHLFGPEDGVPVIALHGWLDNANSFARLAPKLKGLRIIALDMAGHGHSGHRPPGAGYARHRDHRWDRWYWAPQYRYSAPYRYYYPRGYGYRAWHVGHRLPSPYYARHYWVDYRYYRLPPPPHGYHWVRVDRDVVLVAIGTGLILDVFYGLFH